MISVCLAKLVRTLCDQPSRQNVQTQPGAPKEARRTLSPHDSIAGEHHEDRHHDSAVEDLLIEANSPPADPPSRAPAIGF